jgi:phenylacetic acid degradation operon negative regulatory protein
MVITIFGDVIAPHGGEIWLGSLIEVLNILGLNDRLVRTTVSRLAKKNWIESTQIGRKSFYHLTDYGIRSFASATPRIYSGPLKGWDNKWRMVILPTYLKDKALKAKKDQLRKELKWLSFGALTNNLFIHSNPDLDMVGHIISKLDLTEEVIIVNDASLKRTSNNAGENLLEKCWPLEKLAALYQVFIENYQPVLAMLERGDALTPEEALAIRILMINKYRKISLQDPLLPASLLPEEWEGMIAHNLCRKIYRLLLKPSEIFIEANLETISGKMPELSSDFDGRFGGL